MSLRLECASMSMQYVKVSLKLPEVGCQMSILEPLAFESETIQWTPYMMFKIMIKLNVFKTQLLSLLPT